MHGSVAHLFGGAIALVVAAAGVAVIRWNVCAEKNLRVVIPGRLIRGAWQSPEALRAIIARERIKTIVTSDGDQSRRSQICRASESRVETGVSWIIVPMRGSRATLEQMARGGRPAGGSRSTTCLFPLRRRTSPHQSGPRRILDPPCGMVGRGSLERSGQPSLGST